MILTCNSCEKKFVVPDNAIGAEGRLVQCSSCGNKWKQFPIISEKKIKDKVEPIKIIPKKLKKKNTIKKKVGPNLYSPEYLVKKHGIKINEEQKFTRKRLNNEKSISFGFYNYLILIIIILIFVLRILFFSKDILITNYPFTEVYIEYVFESIKNIKEIIFSLIDY